MERRTDEIVDYMTSIVFFSGLDYSGKAKHEVTSITGVTQKHMAYIQDQLACIASCCAAVIG